MRLIKWVGGKHWLVERYPHLLPAPAAIRGVYREPFLGGGAVADRYIGRSKCVLSDANARLIAMYRAVRDTPEAVIEVLRGYKYDRATFEEVRAEFNKPALDWAVAAWFIYLNRTCFNGLYRENKSGQFNVPFGRYTNPTICDADRIRDVSKRLHGVELLVQSYEDALCEVSEDDYVFLDPPYVPVSATANFTGYHAGGFGLNAQERLADSLAALPCPWLLTNADTPETRALYSGWFMESVQVRRAINSKGDKRGAVAELLVSNRPIGLEARAAA